MKSDVLLYDRYAEYYRNHTNKDIQMYLNNFLQQCHDEHVELTSVNSFDNEADVLERLSQTASAIEAIAFFHERSEFDGIDTQCEQLLCAAQSNLTYFTDTLPESANLIEDNFALENLSGLMGRVTKAISDLIERIMEIFNRARKYVAGKLPSARDKLVALRTSLLDKDSLSPAEDKVTISSHKKFFKIENRPLTIDITNALKETVPISEQLAEGAAKDIENVINTYDNVITSLTDVSVDDDPVRIGLETEKLLADIVMVADSPGDKIDDPRWKGYDVSKIPLLNNQAMFFILPTDRVDGSIQTQFNVLSKGLTAIENTTHNPSDSEGTTSFKAMYASEIVEGIDYLLEIIDNIQKHNDNTYMKKLPSKVNDIKKKLITFNESASGDDVNPFVRRNKRNVSNALSGILKMTAIVPTDISKYLNNVVNAYSAVYATMASNLK